MPSAIPEGESKAPVTTYHPELGGLSGSGVRLLPEHRQIEGVPDDTVLWAEEEGLI